MQETTAYGYRIQDGDQTLHFSIFDVPGIDNGCGFLANGFTRQQIRFLLQKIWLKEEFLLGHFPQSVALAWRERSLELIPNFPENPQCLGDFDFLSIILQKNIIIYSQTSEGTVIKKIYHSTLRKYEETNFLLYLPEYEHFQMLVPYDIEGLTEFISIDHETKNSKFWIKSCFTDHFSILKEEENQWHWNLQGKSVIINNCFDNRLVYFIKLDPNTDLCSVGISTGTFDITVDRQLNVCVNSEIVHIGKKSDKSGKKFSIQFSFSDHLLSVKTNSAIYSYWRSVLGIDVNSFSRTKSLLFIAEDGTTVEFAPIPDVEYFFILNLEKSDCKNLDLVKKRGKGKKGGSALNEETGEITANRISVISRQTIPKIDSKFKSVLNQLDWSNMEFNYQIASLAIAEESDCNRNLKHDLNRESATPSLKPSVLEANICDFDLVFKSFCKGLTKAFERKEEISEAGIKNQVYAPHRKHVSEIVDFLVNSKFLTIVHSKTKKCVFKYRIAEGRNMEDIRNLKVCPDNRPQ